MKTKKPRRLSSKKAREHLCLTGLEDSDELLARSKIVLVFKLLAARNKQREIAEYLGRRPARRIAPDERPLQPLYDRQAARFLKRLNQKVTIQGSRHRKGEPFQAGHFRPLSGCFRRGSSGELRVVLWPDRARLTDHHGVYTARAYVAVPCYKRDSVNRCCDRPCPDHS